MLETSSGSTGLLRTGCRRGAPRRGTTRLARAARGAVGAIAVAAAVAGPAPASVAAGQPAGTATFVQDYEVSGVEPGISLYAAGPHAIAVDSLDWSPDGRELAITGEPVADGGSGGVRLLVMTAASGAVRDLGPADGGRPSFSPDGRRIALARGGDIHVVDASTGSRVRLLTPGTASTAEANPTWGARGEIAYEASDGVRVRPATGGTSRLLRRGARYPDYSADGRRISFIDRATSRLRHSAASGGRASDTRIDAEMATWTSDGRAFVVTGVTNGPSCLLASTSGRVLQRLAPEPCWSPTWRPAG